MFEVWRSGRTARFALVGVLIGDADIAGAAAGSGAAAGRTRRAAISGEVELACTAYNTTSGGAHHGRATSKLILA